MMLLHSTSSRNHHSDGTKCSAEPALTKGSSTRTYGWRQRGNTTHRWRFTAACCRPFPGAPQKGGGGKAVIGRRVNSNTMLRQERQERVAPRGKVTQKAEKRNEEGERSRQDGRHCLVMKSHVVTEDRVTRSWALVTVYFMSVSPSKFYEHQDSLAGLSLVAPQRKINICLLNR